MKEIEVNTGLDSCFVVFEYIFGSKYYEIFNMDSCCIKYQRVSNASVKMHGVENK